MYRGQGNNGYTDMNMKANMGIKGQVLIRMKKWKNSNGQAFY